MSGSEGRSEPAAQASPQASGVKVLETLKKHVFEHAEASRYVWQQLLQCLYTRSNLHWHCLQQIYEQS